MSFRSLVLAVAAFSSMHVASADAQWRPAASILEAARSM
jgi:hypothetical protein